MEITFLGTGAGIPSKERNVTAIYVDLSQECKQSWLFDCGEATQHQILHTKIKPRKITKIFITHLHGDHIFGLPGLLSSRSFLSGADPVTIYGPTGIQTYVETSLKVSGTHLSYPLHFVEIEDECILVDDEHVTVECVLLKHNVISFGYKITEKDKPGELNVAKLKELGIKPGPIYRQIKENPSVTTDDGQVLNREDFLGSPKRGKVISIFGDTTYMPQLESFVHNSDVLIHEATFAGGENELALNYGHSTTIEAAQLAKGGNVKQLVMTHISSRYQKNDTQVLLEEAQEVFPNTVIAHDFYTLIVE